MAAGSADSISDTLAEYGNKCSVPHNELETASAFMAAISDLYWSAKYTAMPVDPETIQKARQTVHDVLMGLAQDLEYRKAPASVSAIRPQEVTGFRPWRACHAGVLSGYRPKNTSALSQLAARSLQGAKLTDAEFGQLQAVGTLFLNGALSELDEPARVFERRT